MLIPLKSYHQQKKIYSLTSLGQELSFQLINIHFIMIKLLVTCIITVLHLVTQSCLTFCDSMDCSPPGPSVHGILQARILAWVAIRSSRGSSQPRIKLASLTSPAQAAGSLSLMHLGSPHQQDEIIEFFVKHQQVLQKIKQIVIRNC